MGENLRRLIRRAWEKWLPFRRLTPFLASLFTLSAGFCSLRPLRIILLTVALVLFLDVAADAARSLLDKETGFASYQGPPTNLPVTPLQILLTAVLTLSYFFMILGGLHLIIGPSGLNLVLMLIGVFAFSLLAAWHNVRLWWREGADYEQALKEESQMSRKLRIPPVR